MYVPTYAELFPELPANSGASAPLEKADWAAAAVKTSRVTQVSRE